MLSDRLNVLTGQIELLKERDSLMRDQIIEMKNKNTNFVKDPKNKSAGWLFEPYEMCFNSRTIRSYKLLLPTAMIRLEINGTIYGPFRALLDIGSD